MRESRKPPFNRRQAHENQAFLAALRRTGNVREAARSLGIHRATMIRRRNRNAAFAAEWDAALALAYARLNAAEPAEAAEGEPRIVRTGSGRLQLRRPQARRLDRKAEQAFLAALSATANVRLSAAAAGFSHSAFYARAHASPGFEREMRLALEMGYDRLELALLAAANPDSYRDDGWRHNDPPPIPSISAGEALQLLHLHQKAARLWAERPDRKRRRGETREQHSARLAAKWQANLNWEDEDRAIEAAIRGEGPPGPHEPPPPALPALDQVEGWSKADPDKRGQNSERPMFGGWRIGDWKGK